MIFKRFVNTFCYLLFAGIYTSYGQHAEFNTDSIKSIDEILQYDNDTRFYKPAPITDSLLIGLQMEEMGKTSYKVNYLLYNDSYIKTLPKEREFLTSILKLPLVLNDNYLDSDINSYKSFFVYDSINVDKDASSSLGLYKMAMSTLKDMQSGNVSSFSRSSNDLNKYSGGIALDRNETNSSKLIELRDRKRGTTLSENSNIYAVDIKVRHWVPGFQSSIQFSENYISDNWHKGGTSNLSLYMRNYFSLNYTDDNTRWVNEIESKISTYNDALEELKKPRISDDLLRLSSNYGIKAFGSWYYTIDGEAKTQIFDNYNQDRTVLKTSFLSPVNANIGLGMKYDYSYKSNKTYGRNFKFSLNLAPLSYSLRYSKRKDIDLVALGLTKEKPFYNKFGSTIRCSWVFNITMNTSWQSRMFFNTSYRNVEAEWENTLDMAISKYFSTKLYLNLRFDDSVPPSEKWNKRIQVNQLLSFGFSYKI